MSSILFWSERGLCFSHMKPYISGKVQNLMFSLTTAVSRSPHRGRDREGGREREKEREGERGRERDR